ncbi:MAG: hypothetical protein K6E85_08125 [Lachnospiraceae bacterium]|nr:hypothetical protein [Lachnospiraceae bacterium]
MGEKIKEFFLERIGTIIFLVILAILMLVGTSRIKKARSNAITYTDNYEAPEKSEWEADLLQAGEYVSIANNGQLELFYNDVKGTIEVKNLADGYVWKSIVDEEIYPKFSKANAQWKANMQSAIHIKYNDLKKRDSGVKEIYAGKDCGYLSAEYIENGVAVTYGFLTPGIYITVEYTIDGDELVVKIPYEKIQELSKFAVSSISVLPYMGACGNDNEGYLFYPDGSGAITTFERVAERAANVKMATYFTYTNRSVTLLNAFDEDLYNRYTGAMPVCGIKNGDNAVFAYVTEGAGNTAVTVYPSGVVVDLNRISFDIFTRNVYNVNMYNISSEGGAQATGGQVQRVDKRLIPEDKVIRYAFLSGEKANYSGMAEVYRDHLIENGLLNMSETADNSKLALKLLMGTTKPGIVYDEYISMTTYDQVIEILEGLKAKGISDVELVLNGWQSNFNDFDTWGPDSHLGGKSGLKKLAEYAGENSGLNVYINTDMVLANSDTSGLDEEKDVAYNGLNTEISASSTDGKYWYFRNPNAIRERNTDFLDKLKKYSSINIAYSDIGCFVYADFNEWHPYIKSEAEKELMNTLADTAQAGRSIASSGQNQYVFQSADYVYNLKDEAFGLSITDYAVPFAQMVLSGRVSYSSESMGNLAYDLQTQKLKWIEFGSAPAFYLTYESALKLRNTGMDQLFSSTFSDWEPVMTEVYAEYRQNFSKIFGVRMTEHKVLGLDYRKVTYENGCAVYINYSDKEAVLEGVNVPAKNYVIIEGGR